MAAMLGGSRLSDVFYIAFELSNLARRIIGEGSLSSFVVPLFEGRKKVSEASSWSFVNRAINIVGLVTCALTLIGMIGAREVFNVFGGFGMEAAASKAADPAQAEFIRNNAAHGVFLTRLMFPNLVALAVGSIMMGVCNALGSFTAPALGSVMLNIAMIAAGVAALWGHADPMTGTVWLGYAVLAGAGLRVLIMIPAMRSRGWRYRTELRGGDDSVQRLFRMMSAGLFGMAISQINMSMIGIFATYGGEGNKTFLTYANRLIQFPMALTATAMATAMLPQITRMMINAEHDKLRGVIGFIKRAELVIMLPAALGLMFFGLPIVQMIFQRGEFTDEDARGTYGALLFYSPALIAFGWSRLVQPIYYARQDVRTPVKSALCSMAVNLAAGAFFTFYTHLEQRGLALANTLAAFTDYAVLSWFLRRDPARPLAESRTPETFFKCLAAGIIAIGGTSWIYGRVLIALQLQDAPFARAVLLLLFLGIAAVGYFVLARVLRVPDSERAFDKITGKLGLRRSL